MSPITRTVQIEATLSAVASDALFSAQLAAWQVRRKECLEASINRFADKFIATTDHVQALIGMDQEIVTLFAIKSAAKAHAREIFEAFTKSEPTAKEIRRGVLERFTNEMLSNEIFRRRMEGEIAFEAEARKKIVEKVFDED